MSDPVEDHVPEDGDPRWQYYFLYWSDDDQHGSPRSVARHCRVDGHRIDSALGRDAQWRHTPIIGVNDIGMYDDELVPVATDVALEQVARFRARVPPGASK